MRFASLQFGADVATGSHGVAAACGAPSGAIGEDSAIMTSFGVTNVYASFTETEVATKISGEDGDGIELTFMHL